MLAFQFSRVGAAGHEDSLATGAPAAKAQHGCNRFVWAAQIKFDQAGRLSEMACLLFKRHSICVSRFAPCKHARQADSGSTVNRFSCCMSCLWCTEISCSDDRSLR